MNFKRNESEQKLRGAYYTPPDLSEYLARWLAQTELTNVLEPSCGDGVLIDALNSVVSTKINVSGFEIDPKEARKARERGRSLKKVKTQIKCADFLDWYLEDNREQEQFDAVIGNPPFIRYQYLPVSAQENAERIFEKHELHFTKHTNAWVPFVVASIDLLKAGGRIAMVLPAEIIHVMHAQSLRSFLGEQCERIVIIDPREIWFEDTLQGAVLLLAEKKNHVSDHSYGLGIVPVKGKGFLRRDASKYFQETNFINGKTVEGKWTRALLSKNELNVYETISALDCVHKFTDIAEVDVGLVTGANKFFLVDKSVIEGYELKKWSHPMFGRSGHCPGVIYDEEQHERNVKSGLPAHFVWFNVSDISQLSDSARNYVRQGEKQDFHKRYKCRIRKPWYKVPSVYATSIGMLKRAHDAPRLIYNQMGAYTTDTAYRISACQVNPKKLVYCFMNSFTALGAELEGRHYGGGVLELVPSEIEQLYIPLPEGIRGALRELDNSVRTLPASGVLRNQDKRIFANTGLTVDEIEQVNSAWHRLKARRQRTACESTQ